MPVTIVGAQLGDEGKGGIVDLFCDDADVVARYQGGDNAGHTVVKDGEEFKLSLVPSGAIRGKTGLLGNGCVVNPSTLFSELDALAERGVNPDLRVAERAHVILPYHRVLDSVEESEKSETDLQAGTTGRGIGPTYEDKVGRRGLRVCDLVSPARLREKLEYVVPHKRALLEDVYGETPGVEFDLESLFSEYQAYGDRLQSEGMLVNAGEFLADRLESGQNIMFEGAQGTGIDIDHGIYPFVTSSNPTAGYAATGTGLGPTVVGQGEVVGIIKAYLSRVGTGPLPTELSGDLADTIRERGGEFGTVTGRPRRIGWLDMPMLRHAARTNGFTSIAVNHIDVLAGLDEVKACHAYRLDSETKKTMPPSTEEWGRCTPEYTAFEGWESRDWSAAASEGYEAIPEAAREYLSYIADELETDILAVGVGPNRAETVVRRTPF